MFAKIKRKIDSGLSEFIRTIHKSYPFIQSSPLLLKSIRDFVLGQGKRVRPILFIIGYMGFAKRVARRLYTSAISIELLHDFMLIHDDIIDKSDTRRGKPSMHMMLNNYLRNLKAAKFNGQDLAIVIGDIIYAMAIKAFLSIDEDMARKEKALKKLIEAAVYTGGGEFLELIYGLKDTQDITKDDIYKVYDYKTAYYTFACPLILGAILSGATPKETEILEEYGMHVGRAFQIKDDILGMFSMENKIGKPMLTDLREAKKTILIWYAYNNSGGKVKSRIRRILTKNNVSKGDLLVMRRIIRQSGSLDYARQEVLNLLEKSQNVIAHSKMKPRYRTFLSRYAQKILAL